MHNKQGKPAATVALMRPLSEGPNHEASPLINNTLRSRWLRAFPLSTHVSFILHSLAS
jgi:hypothetical protein